MIYYILTILALNGSVIETDDTLYTFSECRSQRHVEMSRYALADGTKVYVLCTPTSLPG